MDGEECVCEKEKQEKGKPIDALGIPTAERWKEVSCALASLWLVTDR